MLDIKTEEERIISVGTTGHIDHARTVDIYIECGRVNEYDYQHETQKHEHAQPYYRVNERW